MKIIIVGAGISGLSTYLTLKKHLTDLDSKISITIFDSKPSPKFLSNSIAGCPIGLPPNGLRALASFSPSALEHVQSNAFTKGSNVTFRNSSGKTVGNMRFGSSERYGYETCMLPRAVLHQALLKDVDEMDIRWSVRVIAIKEVENSEGGILVECDDGGKEQVDLVIGADGVHSVVKDCLFNKKYQTGFGRHTGIGGFLPMSYLPPTLRTSLQTRTESVTMTFGKDGLFGYANASPLDPCTEPDAPSRIDEPFIMWWSFFDSDNIQDVNNLDFEQIKGVLLKKHGDWVSPHDEKQLTEEKSWTQSQSVFRAIIEGAFQPGSHSSSIPTKPVLIPRFITPRLPALSNATYTERTSSPSNRGRIVLIGDAAHTISPDVGQGASCAIEDSVVYAQLLKHYLSPQSEAPPIQDFSTAEKKDFLSTDRISKALESTAKAYESIRRPRVSCLTSTEKCDTSMKEMNSFCEWLRDMAIWVLSKCPESINDCMFAYDTEAVVAKYLTDQKAGRSSYCS